MRYEEEGQVLKDRTKCAQLRAELKMCLLESDCCRIHKKTPRECLRVRNETVPDACYVLHQSFYDCKRSIIDAKRRMRGVPGS